MSEELDSRYIETNRLGELAFSPVPNMSLRMGEPKGGACFVFSVKRNIPNRLKFWLFCKFFPFTIERWE